MCDLCGNEPQAKTYTCDVDRYYATDSHGNEHYWHCEEPSVAVLPDGTQVCKDHALEAMEQQS